MGALIAYFAVASVVAVPFLAYQLLRTRRELNQLRTELQRRGVIAPSPGAGWAAVPAGTPEPLPAVGPPPERGDSPVSAERPEDHRG